MDIDRFRQLQNSGKALMHTLRDSELAAVAVDLADKPIEAILGVPILGAVVGLFKAAGTVSDYLFTKKLLRFLLELKDVPPDVRREHIDRLAESDHDVETAGERILLLLDKMNDTDKPTLMGRAYRAFLNGQINLDQLRDFCQSLDALDMRNLSILAEIYNNPQRGRLYSLGDVQNLIICGLLELAIEPDYEAFDIGEGQYERGKFITGAKLRFETNSLGQLFVQLARAS